MIASNSIAAIDNFDVVRCGKSTGSDMPLDVQKGANKSTIGPL